MIRGQHFTDGMVVDHVAEFCYFPASSLRTLYSLDRLGYIDSIARFLQLLAMAPSVAFLKATRRPTAARLRENLKPGGKLDEESPAIPELSEVARKEALRQVHQNWAEIDKTIQEKPTTLDALEGHVQREFRQCFLAPEAERQSTFDYLQLSDARILSAPTRDYLLRSVGPLAKSSKLQPNEVGSWLDRMVTTHYRNFFDYSLYCPYEYTPAATRADLTFVLQRGPVEPFRGIVRCVAVDILKTVKKRDELIDRSLEWCSNSKGQELLERFGLLRENFAIATAQEKESLTRDINSVLESPVRFWLGMVSGFMSTVKGAEPKPNISFYTPPQLRWLYAIRQPSAILKLADLIDSLVKG